MKIAVPAETRPGERRVAAVPDTVAPLVAAGLEVVVQSGAGAHVAARTTRRTRAAGATVVEGDVLADADVVLHVRPLLPPSRSPGSDPGAVTVGFLAPSAEPDGVARSGTPRSPRSRSSWCRASRARSRWTR